MKKIIVFFLTALSIMAVSAVAMAADATTSSAALDTIGKIALAAGLAIGIGVIGPGIGQGLAVLGSTNGIARNPEAAGTIRVTMIIGLALMESLTIYALVVALILIYAFPFNETLLKIVGSIG